MNSSSQDSGSTRAATRSALPQPYRCERCDEPATADDWIDGLGALLCPTCLEILMDTPTEDLL